MIGAMAGFVFNDGFMRVALAELPLFQAICLRGVILVPLLAAIAWRRGALFYKSEGPDRWRIRLRSLCELMGTFLFLSALTMMPFAEISAIMQALPLAVTLGAAVFLGAPIGWRRISAILIGFLGVLIIIRPGAEAFSFAAILVLGVVAIVAIRDLATRVLSPTVPSVAVALHAAIVITLCNGAFALAGDWVPIGPSNWLLLAAAAFCLTFGYICSVATMRIGDIATIAPFRYTALLWSVLIGVLAFSEIPDIWTIVGSVIIVATGIYSFYREQSVKDATPKA